MRWSHKKPKEGDRKRREMFLFVPRTIGGETRWLEEACIEYEWRDSRLLTSGRVGWSGWRPVAWID